MQLSGPKILRQKWPLLLVCFLALSILHKNFIQPCELVHHLHIIVYSQVVGYGHNSLFPMLLGWAMMDSFCNIVFPQAINYSENLMFSHCYFQVLNVEIPPLHTLICILRHFLIGVAGNLLKTWPYYIRHIFLILSFIGDISTYPLILSFLVLFFCVFQHIHLNICILATDIFYL